MSDHPTVAASFDVDEKTVKLMVKLQKALGVNTNAAVIRYALALIDIASNQAGPDNTIIISGEGKMPVKIILNETV